MRGISHFLVSYKLYVPPANCYHKSVLVLGITMDVGPILSHHRKTRYLTKEHPGSPTLQKWKCNHKWSPLIVSECVSVMRLHFFLQLWFFKFFHKVLALGKALATHCLYKSMCGECQWCISLSGKWNVKSQIDLVLSDLLQNPSLDIKVLIYGEHHPSSICLYLFFYYFVHLGTLVKYLTSTACTMNMVLYQYVKKIILCFLRL